MTDLKPDALHSIEREVRQLLHRVRRTSMENARLVHPDLQPAAYSVLLYVADNEPTRARDIVEQLGVDKGAVSRQLGWLVRIGLVERNPDAADHRVQVLTVSTEGRARLAKVRATRRTEFVGRLSAWSATDLAGLAEQLGRYNASLDAVRD